MNTVSVTHWKTTSQKCMPWNRENELQILASNQCPVQNLTNWAGPIQGTQRFVPYTTLCSFLQHVIPMKLEDKESPCLQTDPTTVWA